MKCARCALDDDTVEIDETPDMCIVCGPIPLCPQCTEEHRAAIAEGVDW